MLICTAIKNLQCYLQALIASSYRTEIVTDMSQLLVVLSYNITSACQYASNSRISHQQIF